MFKMLEIFQKSTISAILFVVTMVDFNAAAQAENANVNFEGILRPRASLSKPNKGALKGKKSKKPTTAINDKNSDEDTIATEIPATVTIETNSAATIYVSPPELVSGTTVDPPGTTYIGSITFGSTTIRSDVGGGQGTIPIGNTTLQVNMEVQRPVAYLAGTYNYVVRLTVIP
jgi:hypothetical protein